MSYTKNTWVDRIAIGDNKFTDQNGNNYEFTPNPDSVTTAGTPFSASWMNNIENGILNAMHSALLEQQYELETGTNLNNLSIGSYRRVGLVTGLVNEPSDVSTTAQHAWLFMGTEDVSDAAYQLLIVAEDNAVPTLGEFTIYIRFCPDITASPRTWWDWCTLYAPKINMTEDLDFASGWSANTSGKNYVSRQYNRCVLSISAKCTSAMSPSTANTIATIINDKLKPKYTTYGVLYGYHSSTPTIDRVTVNTDGTVQIQGTTAANTSITGMVVYDAAGS